MKVAITGSDEDNWVREAFCDSDVIDLVGHTTLPQLIALYRECAAVVTHDSGPLHLARLAHASLVALFGPTLPASFVPRDDRTVVVWPGMDLPCCPCYDGKEFASCANNLCMQMIAPSVVVDAVVGLIERTRIPRNH